MRKYQMIEPSRGATYNRPGEFAVYEYDTYPRSSVLAGQERRSFLDSFDSLEAAQIAYPNAHVSKYSLYREPDLSHLPDDDDDAELERSTGCTCHDAYLGGRACCPFHGDPT